MWSRCQPCDGGDRAEGHRSGCGKLVAWRALVPDPATDVVPTTDAIVGLGHASGHGEPHDRDVVAVRLVMDSTL